ncbi:SDR family NAD(P)-dependent oxidoreductase [Curtobacterium sp. MCBD17_003]|uniref:SDR family NAD(P)-dependent oxidoreductase n=1 Tax=Curtobacterium sp. MCBD17_003 TaxID=2175667 RepID=UPI000DA71A84|nr:SDR family NAD(P)-dependent oxidoreductase [Curtobacterium sp. MCBD17_003]WIE55629.1 SDR family NAD(P)-dependent oxidoreductase [Curtobacterium sp. MCBD17_003]
MTVAFPAARTAIVTGAVSPRGIGRATARRLAAAGWDIGIIDLDDDASAEAASELAASFGVRAAGVGADVSDEAEVRGAVDELESALPQIVALVNIAGISSPTPYLELQPGEWDRVIAVNLTGVHHVSRRVAESLAASGVGRIVSISSVSAQRGGGTYSKTPYSVAKAGVIGLTRALARELGPLGVTANAIAPGPIDTDIMGGTLTEERKAEMAADLLVGRIGTVDDVAVAVEFLLREDTGFITGHTLDVNGGLYMN